MPEWVKISRIENIKSFKVGDKLLRYAIKNGFEDYITGNEKGAVIYTIYQILPIHSVQSSTSNNLLFVKSPFLLNKNNSLISVTEKELRSGRWWRKK